MQLSFRKSDTRQGIHLIKDRNAPTLRSGGVGGKQYHDNTLTFPTSPEELGAKQVNY